MSNSIPIPYQGDALDIAVAKAEHRLIAENAIGVVFGFMIGDEFEVHTEYICNSREAMTKFVRSVNCFMQRINSPDLPIDVVTRPVGWGGLDAGLLRELVRTSFESFG